MLRRICLVAVLVLAGCAHKPVQTAAACDADGMYHGVMGGLQKVYPDPKGHHELITSRTKDARGNLVLTLDVWPLSGPQEPAPPKKARLVLAPCTYEPLEATRLPA